MTAFLPARDAHMHLGDEHPNEEERGWYQVQVREIRPNEDGSHAVALAEPLFGVSRWRVPYNAIRSSDPELRDTIREGRKRKATGVVTGILRSIADKTEGLVGDS